MAAITNVNNAIAIDHIAPRFGLVSSAVMISPRERSTSAFVAK